MLLIASWAVPNTSNSNTGSTTSVSTITVPRDRTTARDVVFGEVAAQNIPYKRAHPTAETPR